jgi:serine/threonine protein kinase
MDFGLAISQDMIDKDASLAGTLAYLAPEIMQGAPASVQSDLWAVGHAFVLIVG